MDKADYDRWKTIPPDDKEEDEEYTAEDAKSAEYDAQRDEEQ